jgi:hypothetical protein
VDEDEGTVVELVVETSCSCEDVVDEEAVRRTRLVPAGAAIKYQYPVKLHVTSGSHIPNGSALATQHRMAAHNRGSREESMTSIYIGTPQLWRRDRVRVTHAAVSVEQLLVMNG